MPPMGIDGDDLDGTESLWVQDIGQIPVPAALEIDFDQAYGMLTRVRAILAQTDDAVSQLGTVDQGALHFVTGFGAQPSDKPTLQGAQSVKEKETKVAQVEHQ